MSLASSLFIVMLLYKFYGFGDHFAPPNVSEEKMPLGIILGLGRAMRRKRTSSLDILSSKRAPRNYYKGKNCKPTGFHTRKGVIPIKFCVNNLSSFYASSSIKSF